MYFELNIDFSVFLSQKVNKTESFTLLRTESKFTFCFCINASFTGDTWINLQFKDKERNEILNDFFFLFFLKLIYFWLIQSILLFRVSKPADLEESKGASRTVHFPKEREKSNFTTGQSLYTNSIYKDFTFTPKQFNAEFN